MQSLHFRHLLQQSRPSGHGHLRSRITPRCAKGAAGGRGPHQDDVDCLFLARRRALTVAAREVTGPACPMVEYMVCNAAAYRHIDGYRRLVLLAACQPLPPAIAAARQGALITLAGRRALDGMRPAPCRGAAAKRNAERPDEPFEFPTGRTVVAEHVRTMCAMRHIVRGSATTTEQPPGSRRPPRASCAIQRACALARVVTVRAGW